MQRFASALLASSLLLLACRAAAAKTKAKGIGFTTRYWNSTCRYQALDIPPTEFFKGQEYADTTMMPFPLEVQEEASKRYKYPVYACFGPNEAYDDAAVAKGDRLPCRYRFNANFNIDYWEEQPCLPALFSNSYCYGLNRYRAGFCVPGGSANRNRVDWTCTSLNKAIMDDGGTPVTWDTVQTQLPKGTHYIAAGISPKGTQQGSDFAIWRYDANGAWSWKAGYTFARNSYKNGTAVRDIRDPTIRKIYTKFCGFFDVDAHTHTLWSSGVSNSDIAKRFRAWDAAKWKVRVEPLPAWSKGWFKLYEDTYVGQSLGDVNYNQQPGAADRAKGRFKSNLEAFRSQPLPIETKRRTRTGRRTRPGL